MKPNRNMIAPCPFLPHDVGAYDCGSAVFFIIPFFPFSGLAQRMYACTYVRVSRSRISLASCVYRYNRVWCHNRRNRHRHRHRRRDTSMCDTSLLIVVTESKHACATLCVYGTVRMYNNKSVHVIQNVHRSWSGDRAD